MLTFDIVMLTFDLQMLTFEWQVLSTNVAENRMSNFVSFYTSVQYGLRSFDGPDGPERLCRSCAREGESVCV